MTSVHAQTRRQRPARASAGFTLLELVVAMAVFLVLGSAAVKLANQSVGVSVSQQGQSALNISIRNASAQMQIDLINAGTGYFPTYNIPGAPLGVVINNVSSTLDTLTILSFDPTIVAHPSVSPTNTTGATITVTPVGTTPALLQAGYTSGSILMMFSNTVNASSGMPYITTFPISGASAGGSTVTVNISTPNVAPIVGASGTWPADPLGISSTYGVSDLIQNADGSTSPGICYLSDGVSPMPAYDTTDWVLKVNSITYSVNGSNQLVRTVNGVAQIIADNIMSFRVGALLYGQSAYQYVDANPISDPRKIRSVRVSLIAKTTYNTTSPFRNTYDGGPYRVEGTSFIVNPRNLSLHD